MNACVPPFSVTASNRGFQLNPYHLLEFGSSSSPCSKMNSTSSNGADKETRQSLLYAVGSICDDYAQKQQQERAATHRARPTPSKATLAILADLLYTETEIVATELQHFAHHANRKVIKPEDVVLVARKDPEMVKSLQKYQREHLPSAASKKRRRGAMDD